MMSTKAEKKTEKKTNCNFAILQGNSLESKLTKVSKKKKILTPADID